MKKKAYLLILAVALTTLQANAAIDSSDVDEASGELAGPPDTLILKDEDPLKVNPQLNTPQKNVNLQAIQKEVLNIALPEESPEEVEERAPVEE